MNEFEMNKENEILKEEPLTVAADSLVHFTDGSSPLFHDFTDDDSMVATEVARITYLCMTEAVS